MPIIRAILENLLGPEDAARMEIVANEVDVKPDGKFEILFRHPESGFGHDKSKALRVYRELNPKPTIFFCGDGVSGECGKVFVTRDCLWGYGTGCRLNANIIPDSCFPVYAILDFCDADM